MSALSSKDTATQGELIEQQVPPLAAVGTNTLSSRRLDEPYHITGSRGDLTADVYQILRPFSEDETSKYYRIVVREHFTIRDIVKYGLITMGYAVSPDLLHCAALLPFRHWAELVESNYADVNIKQAISAGVHLLAQLDPPPQWLPAEGCNEPGPKLNTNVITIKAMSFVAAMLTNAAQLRVPPEALMDDCSQSRFYSSGTETSELEEDMSRNNIPLAFDLKPTAIQRRVPHHPGFDLVPWPSFRSKIIHAISVNPPLIDEDDLCLDMFGGGLRCWGSAHGSAHGNGQGVPWDSRSWEAMPWFLEKWEIITGGEEEEASRHSAWWRAMRNGNGDETERWDHV